MHISLEKTYRVIDAIEMLGNEDGAEKRYCPISDAINLALAIALEDDITYLDLDFSTIEQLYNAYKKAYNDSILFHYGEVLNQKA